MKRKPLLRTMGFRAQRVDSLRNVLLPWSALFAVVACTQWPHTVGQSAETETESPEAAAFRAMGDLGLSVKATARERIIRQIVGALEKIELTQPASDHEYVQFVAAHEIQAAAQAALIKIGDRADETLPVYVEALNSGSVTARRAAALVIAKKGSRAKEHLNRAFEEIPPERIADFYRSVLPGRRFVLGSANDDYKEIKQLARVFSKEHASPKARAISFSVAIVIESAGSNSRLDLDLLNSIFTTDPDPLVKSVAIRIAGFLGQCEGTLDLKRILLEEKNPRLLQAAIEARGAWSSFYGGDTLELWEGLRCDWIPGSVGRRRSEWDEEERKRLREILLGEKDPDLRDAASMALAEFERSWDPHPQPRRLAGLKVHEWGVFLDAGKTLIPPEKVLSDLPAFVHRSEIGADELWSSRSYSPTRVTKPVLFFYAPEPSCLLLQVRFFEGRPWTFYPHATDYSETTEIVSYRTVNGMPSVKSSRSNFSDAPGLRPDWLSKSKSLEGVRRQNIDRTLPPPAELRRFYRVAEWLHPNHSEHPTVTGAGPVAFTGMGMEWCGLRVGYPEKLESEVRPAPEGSWWRHLRDVPSDHVTVRGERERFVFYDGSTNVPAPVLAAWKDSSRQGLVLRTRSFGSYPPVEESVRRAWLGAYREPSTFRESEEYPDAAPLPAVFIVRKSAGMPCQGAILERVPSRAGPMEVSLAQLVVSETDLRRQLEEKLTAEGLTAPEAKSLLSTWERDFFEAPGLRLITILPRWFYDAMLPIQIAPAPSEVARVGLVLKECLELDVEEASPHNAPMSPEWVNMVRSPLEVQESSFAPGESIPLPLESDGTIHWLPQEAFPYDLTLDGRSIVFRRERKPVAIYLADIEERLMSLVFEDRAREHLPRMDCAVSGDGKRLFRSMEKRLQIFDTPRKKLFDVPMDAHRSEIQASDDGTRAAWLHYDEEGQHVSVIDLESREILRVDLPGSRSETWSRSRLAFSSDGKKLACVAAEEGQEDVWLIDLEEETVVNVSGHPANDGEPWLARGGRLVLFSSARDRGGSLYLADLEAKTLARIGEHGKGARPIITEDGTKVVYGMEGSLWRMTVATGELERLLASDHENISVRAMSRDGRRVLAWWTDRSTRRLRASLHEVP